ncbi:unnamed protein product, partial [Porites lobata]
NKWFEGIIGIITCKLLRASPFILPVFSVWILVAIAVDRFFAKTVVFLWVWSAVSGANVLALIGLRKEKTYDFCETGDKVYYGWREFSLTSLVLNVVVPLVAIIILYTIICLKLWARKVPGEGANQNERQVEAIKTAKKVTRMMIAVVVLYKLCWLPYFIIMLMTLIKGESHSMITSDPPTGNIYLYLFILWSTIAYSAVNPFVYLTFNQKFRNGFKHLYKNFLTKPRGILPFRSQNSAEVNDDPMSRRGNSHMKGTGMLFEGILGIITCKLLRASPFILSAFSVWILVAIAVDRFFAVTRPFQVSPLSRHFKKTVVFLWVWSAVSAANILALIGLVKEKTSDFCETVEKVYYWWREFFLTSLVLNVVVPLVAVIILYTIICLKLWARKVPGEGANRNERQVEAIKTAKKV